jgi:hypothetical protein
VKYAQTLLAEIGLGSERIQMVNVSAAMGVQFAQTAREFSEKIQEIGPNPLKKAESGRMKAVKHPSAFIVIPSEEQTI